MTFKCLKHIASSFVAFANLNIIITKFYMYLLTICVIIK